MNQHHRPYTRKDGSLTLGEVAEDVMDSLAGSSAMSTKELAQHTGRDYKRVSDCLGRLLRAGLVQRSGRVSRGRHGTTEWRYHLTPAGVQATGEYL